jgi:serine phosphatase RsbU (regulator of sigma subunit)/anti-sigma regulatory factor (Ser/Thr protein kinase)
MGDRVGAKRPGRPWAAPRGWCSEINELVGLVRSWLDGSTVTVPQLHTRLTSDHFRDGLVPELRKLRQLLSGDGLSWELVEAVADVCFPDESAEEADDRLALARALWQSVQNRPTASPAEDTSQATARELLVAQQRTIEVYQELDHARRAYQVSEHGRHQALQAATLVFALLGGAQAKIAELTRRLDAFQAGGRSAPGKLEALQHRLERAKDQEGQLRLQLARAEEERDTAQQVADHAARRIHTLETELASLRARMDPDHEHEPGQSPALEMNLPSVQTESPDADDAAMDDVDRALDKVREVLAQEHEAVQEAAEGIGWHDAGGLQGTSDQIVTGEVVPGPADQQPPSSASTELFGENPNNPASKESPGTALAARGSAGQLEQVRYIGAATRRISRGIDLDEILLGLCRAAVPAFADAILVYLRDPLPVGDDRPARPLMLRLRRSDRLPDGTPEAITVAENSNLLSERSSPERYFDSAAGAVDVSLDGPLAEVLRKVHPVLGDSAQASAALDELLLSCADGPPIAEGDGGARDGQPFAFPSGRRAILVPMRGRRRVIGATVLLRDHTRSAFGPDDLPVASQLATQTALGVDKALLYSREARFTDTLQREMLPGALPQPPGIQLASRYLPAAESERIGGDWYDAIPLPGGRVALVIGDVKGHSVTSAAVMGQLRTTVQTLAGLDLAPQEVLYHLDEQVQRLGQDRMATCVYAVYDPIEHRVAIANAGHPPPMLLHPDGLAEVLRVVPEAPIGVGGVPFEAVELPAPAGATLLLYTDGLVESRARDVWGGIGLLRERLHAACSIVCPPPLEPLCDEVLKILGPGDRDDDVALLAARFEGIAPHDVAYWTLNPRPDTAGQARRLVRGVLQHWNLESLTQNAELLVSEVVTNAIHYAERPITLRLLRTDVLRCEVGDEEPTMPRIRYPQLEDERGRGLYIVNRIAQRWGATRLNNGKVVWFELPLPPRSPSRSRGDASGRG